MAPKIKTNNTSSVNLVGDFNAFEKHESNWIISPSNGESKNTFETTT